MEPRRKARRRRCHAHFAAVPRTWRNPFRAAATAVPFSRRGVNLVRAPRGANDRASATALCAQAALPRATKVAPARGGCPTCTTCSSTCSRPHAQAEVSFARRRSLSRQHPIRAWRNPFRAAATTVPLRGSYLLRAPRSCPIRAGRNPFRAAATAVPFSRRSFPACQGMALKSPSPLNTRVSAKRRRSPRLSPCRKAA